MTISEKLNLFFHKESKLSLSFDEKVIFQEKFFKYDNRLVNAGLVLLLGVMYFMLLSPFVTPTLINNPWFILLSIPFMGFLFIAPFGAIYFGIRRRYYFLPSHENSYILLKRTLKIKNHRDSAKECKATEIKRLYGRFIYSLDNIKIKSATKVEKKLFNKLKKFVKGSYKNFILYCESSTVRNIAAENKKLLKILHEKTYSRLKDVLPVMEEKITKNEEFKKIPETSVGKLTKRLFQEVWEWSSCETNAKKFKNVASVIFLVIAILSAIALLITKPDFLSVIVETIRLLI